jgi:hypothetical protein
MVEVSFTISPRVRRIAAHDPKTLPPIEYYRQVFFSSEIDLPDDWEERFASIVLELIQLGPGEKAFLSLNLPPEFVIIFDAVTHSTQFISVQGEPTQERLRWSHLFGQFGGVARCLVPVFGGSDRA